MYAITLVKVQFEALYGMQLNHTIETMIRNELSSNMFDAQQLGNYVYMLIHGSNHEQAEPVGMLTGRCVGVPITAMQLDTHRNGRQK